MMLMFLCVNCLDSWGTARVVIDVNDVNNNAPQWVYVPYPRDTMDAPDGTRGIFITAVDYSSPPDTVAMQFKVSSKLVKRFGSFRLVQG